jgi:hypothetical protein
MTKLVASATLILSLFVSLVDSVVSPSQDAVAGQSTIVAAETANAVQAPVGSGAIDTLDIRSGSPAELLIVGGSPLTRSEIQEAASKFSAAGLELPALTINVRSSQTACDGAVGMFRPNPAGHTIDLCRTGELLVLHELAHAWAHEALTDTDRAAFVQRTGLPTWKSHAYPHGLRATEVAAEAIVVGLRSEPLAGDDARRILKDLEHFVALTGFEPPRLVGTIADIANLPMPTIDPVQVSIYATRRGV